MPTGFKPATASAADLAKYGFPPRPTPGQDAGWLQAMNAWREAAPADGGHPWKCPIEHAPGPSSGLNATWGGNEFDSSAVGGSIIATSINFVLTPLQPDYNHTDDSVVAPWTGLGGDTLTSGGTLVQAGIDMGSGSSGGSNSYNSWWEVIDGHQSLFAHYDTPSIGLAVGNDIYVEVSYSGATAYFWRSWHECGSAVALFVG